jgi:hypothetical protein
MSPLGEPREAASRPKPFRRRFHPLSKPFPPPSPCPFQTLSEAAAKLFSTRFQAASGNLPDLWESLGLGGWRGPSFANS